MGPRRTHRAEAAVSLDEHDPILLTARDGTAVADVQLSVAAPQLLAALQAERGGAPSIKMTIRTLSLHPELLRGRAAWGGPR